MNNKGFTLIEVIISIAVSSIILVMLTQMLSMNLKLTNTIEKDNILFTQSISISDNIQNGVFELQAQKVELISDDDSATVIHITHEYDITIDNVSGVLSRNYDNPVVDILIYDKDNQSITYNGVKLHRDTIKIMEGSSITFVPVDANTCTTDPDSELCKEGIIILDLIITYQRDLEDESTQIDPKQFVSTIII